MTVLDKTKVALALQQAPATLDGDKVDLDSLARGGQKRKTDDPVESTSKKVTFSEEDIKEACNQEFIMGDLDESGLGTSQNTEQSETNEDPNETPADVNSQTENGADIHQPAISSSQGHNVAQLIRDHVTSSENLIMNYISALKKK